MSDNVSRNDGPRFSFSFFGATIAFEPRSWLDWIPIIVILIGVGFFTVLFLDNVEWRKELASRIYPPAPSATPSRSADDPSRPDAKQIPVDQSAEHKVPPVEAQKQPITTDKADPEATIREAEGENKSSSRDTSIVRPTTQQPKLYRVRTTTPRNDQPFAFLPLRRKPGAKEPTIKDIPAGAGGLIGTGKTRDIYESWIDELLDRPRVRWIQVRYENDVGWVSGPYLEEISAEPK